MGLSSWNSASDCYNNDWLFNSSLQWTITPFFSNSNVIVIINSTGDIYRSRAYDTTVGVNPVVILKSNVKIVDGDGSSSNPYTLSM